jgi:thymidylate synthase
MFMMRSNDVFLGHPFNIFSYTVLTYIIALKCGLKPGKLVYVGGDVHIYQNHIQQIQQQIQREPRPFPKLIVNPDVKYKDISEISVSDFDIIGYFPHQPIKAPMAV